MLRSRSATISCCSACSVMSAMSRVKTSRGGYPRPVSRCGTRNTVLDRQLNAAGRLDQLTQSMIVCTSSPNFSSHSPIIRTTASKATRDV
jgi:hypothetical protein